MMKTYYIDGLTDYLYIFNAGKTRVKVYFSGGSVTAYGMVPASFKTDNPVLQKMIENSGEFRTGKIRCGISSRKTLGK